MDAALANVQARGERAAAQAARAAIARMTARIALALPPGLRVAAMPDGVVITGRGAKRRLIDSGRWEAIRR